MKKILWISALSLTVSLTALNAQTPIEAARNTPQITQKLFRGYLNGHDTHTVISRLCHTQEMLKHAIHDKKLNNLLSYLDLCINDLRQAVTRPATDANIRHINDLLGAISEGNRFIIHALSHQKVVVAIR